MTNTDIATQQAQVQELSGKIAANPEIAALFLTQQAQALEFTGRIAANPAIAASFLKQLEAVGNDPAKLEALTQAGLKAITAELPAAAEEAPVSLESRRDALLEQFGIEVVGEGKVRLALGETSRIDFLRKVQEVASELYGHHAIWSDDLQAWGTDSAFTAMPENGGEIGVDGNVSGSKNKTRAEQEKKGWNNVDFADLAVAHAAYFLATGKDLFDGNAVRARRGDLYFYRDGGLCVYRCIDYSYSYDDVAASAALPPRN